MPDHGLVARKIGEIEAELKRLGRWQDTPLPEAAYKDMGPFGMNTMAYEQWIQFVLIPRVREILVSKGEFPRKSQVGVLAVRDFDGDLEADKLVTLLCEFDELF
jgi:uncharacterized protein YqcC (DUF446 family)